MEKVLPDRDEVIVKKTLCLPFETAFGGGSENYGYTAHYDGYEERGDTEEEAIDNLLDTLRDEGYEED